MVKNTTTTGGRWSPTQETFDAMGRELCSHWVATHAVPASPFWPRPVSWLNRQAARLTGSWLIDRKLTI